MKTCREYLDALIAKARQIRVRGWRRIRDDSANAPGAEAYGSPDSRGHWDDLKLLIVSTPKTGNTWVKHLLSVTYDLPIVQIPLKATFSAEGLDELGERWIAHQHYYPVMSLLQWAEQENVRFITTTRHPGDTLVSLYHHVHNRRHPNRKTMGLAATMERDRQGPGEYTAQYVRREFYYALNMSISWMGSGLSIVVRYEDLRRDADAVLVDLTSQIAEVSRDRIERAVSACEIDRLRKRYDPNGRFFRKGAVGDWAQELPKGIVDLFRQCEPYPTQFAVLGYDVDPPALISARDVRDVPASDVTPCGGDLEMDATSVPPIARDLYASRKQASIESRASGTREFSTRRFLDWLNAPAENDPYRDTAAPLITNLAAHIHRIRPDIQMTFPDIYRANRVDYAHWFAVHARDEYQLDAAFTLPIILSWMSSREVLRPC